MKTAVLTILSCFAICSSYSQTDSASYFFNLGKTEKSAGRTLPAYQYFEKAIHLAPENAEYRREGGNAALGLRKYEFARQHFEHLYQLDKNDTTAIIQLAEINFNLRRWNDAIVYAILMQQKQLGHHSNYILGKSYYQQENYGQSNKYFLAASKEEPNNAEIPYLMARSYVDMDNYKMAVQYYEQALAKDTANAKWYYETAFIYFGVPDAKKSVQYFEKAISKGYHATNDDWENVANAYVAAGQTDKGLQLLKELLEKKPADMDLLWNVANASFKMKKYDDAIACWDKMREYDNTNAEALYMIGLSYQKKGENAKGQQICDKAIEMDPSLRRYREKKEMPSGGL